MSSSPTDPQRVAEATARQLLARAAQLDSDGLTLEQLRESAIEAGISPAAFDQAVREWRNPVPAKRRVARPPSLSQRLLRNAGAFAGGWAALAALSAIDRLLAVPWLVHKLTDPVGLAVGAAIALKLRARTATAVLGGLTVSQFAEYLLDFISGAPAIHGLAPHIALMFAGIAGIAAGQHFWFRGSGFGSGTSQHLAEQGSSSEAESRELELHAASA